MSKRTMISKLQFGTVDQRRRREPSLPLITQHSIAHQRSRVHADRARDGHDNHRHTCGGGGNFVSTHPTQSARDDPATQRQRDEKTHRSVRGGPGEAPASLDDLVTAGYMHDIPVDPTTGEKDWVVDMGEDTISREGGTGVIDVHSNSPAQGSDGRPYREY